MIGASGLYGTNSVPRPVFMRLGFDSLLWCLARCSRIVGVRIRLTPGAVYWRPLGCVGVPRHVEELGQGVSWKAGPDLRDEANTFDERIC